MENALVVLFVALPVRQLNAMRVEYRMIFRAERNNPTMTQHHLPGRDP